MKVRPRLRSLGKHLAFGLLVPAILLFNAAAIPEPYSIPLIYLAISPGNVLPFLQDRELMQELTLAVFGRQTPNYAPIQVLFLTLFWFLVGTAGSIAHSWLSSRRSA